MRAAYLMAVQWDFLWQRPQALCEVLSERHEILAVEAPLPLMEALRQPRRFWRNLARWLWGARRVNPNLLVVTPFPLRLPLGRRLGAIAAINDLLLYGSLRWVRFRLRLKPVDVVISTLPDMIRALSALEARATVYDCADDYAGFTPGGAQALLRREAELCRRVDAVVVVSDRLASLKRPFNTNVHVIRNGVPDLFLAAEPSAAGLSRRPRLGFVGAIYPWVDVDLLARLAEERPDCDIVLVGPVRTDVTPLQGKANVELVGPKPHDQLPAVLAGFDVCLLPFRLNDLTLGANPVKLYEYLAQGKPVVATAIDEAASFDGLIRVAQTAGEFIRQVGLALAEAASAEAEALFARRVQYAAQHTWQARARALEDVITPIARPMEDRHGSFPVSQ